MLLPHLGFAHQELGEYDKALATFDEAYRLSPKDPIVAGYLDRRQHRREEVRRRRGAREEGAGGEPQRPEPGTARGAGAPSGRKGGPGRRRARGGAHESRRRTRRVRGARADVQRRLARTAGRQAAAGRPGEVPGVDGHRLRAGRDLREAEELCRRRSGVSPGAGARAGARRGAQLSRLHAGRAGRTAGRVRRVPEEGAGDRARQRLVPRQPGLGVLQGRQARSRRGKSAARRRAAPRPTP